MLARVLVAGFLLAHAGIHISYLTPRPPLTAGGPPWPFDLARSWLLSPLGVDAALTRLFGLALIAATFGGFALAALGALGIGPTGLWVAGIGVGAVASVALLLIFFHPWLALGLVIDVALLWAVLVAGWSPQPEPLT